jgi:hypothetical protein
MKITGLLSIGFTVAIMVSGCIADETAQPQEKAQINQDPQVATQSEEEAIAESLGEQQAVGAELLALSSAEGPMIKSLPNQAPTQDAVGDACNCCGCNGGFCYIITGGAYPLCVYQGTVQQQNGQWVCVCGVPQIAACGNYCY